MEILSDLTLLNLLIDNEIKSYMNSFNSCSNSDSFKEFPPSFSIFSKIVKWSHLHSSCPCSKWYCGDKDLLPVPPWAECITEKFGIESNDPDAIRRICKHLETSSRLKIRWISGLIIDNGVRRVYLNSGSRLLIKKKNFVTFCRTSKNDLSVEEYSLEFVDDKANNFWMFMRPKNPKMISNFR